VSSSVTSIARAINFLDYKPRITAYVETRMGVMDHRLLAVNVICHALEMLSKYVETTGETLFIVRHYPYIALRQLLCIVFYYELNANCSLEFKLFNL
jgi:hypothetical protein